jgi:hypothetical protein
MARSKSADEAEKLARLQAALRENLRRRKQQRKARSSDSASGEAAEEPLEQPSGRGATDAPSPENGQGPNVSEAGEKLP